MRFWVRSADKQSLGPFTPEQIRKIRGVTGDTLVYPETGKASGDWKHVRDVPELHSTLQKASPPPTEVHPAPSTTSSTPVLPAVATGSAMSNWTLLALATVAGGAIGTIGVIGIRHQRGGATIIAPEGVQAAKLLKQAETAPAAPPVKPESSRESQTRSSREPAPASLPVRSRPQPPPARYHAKNGNEGFHEFNKLAEVLQAKYESAARMGPISFQDNEEYPSAYRKAGEILMIPWDQGKRSLDLEYTPAPSVGNWQENGNRRSFFLLWSGNFSWGTIVNPRIVHVECEMPLPQRRTQMVFAEFVGNRKFQNQYGETTIYPALKAFAVVSSNRIVRDPRGADSWWPDPEDVFTFDDDMIARLKR